MDSRAFLAASRARLAIMALSRIIRATLGFSSRYSSSFSLTTAAVRVRMEALPSLAFVCPSNWASVSLTEMTHIRPSRQSSPETLSSPLMMLFFLP